MTEPMLLPVRPGTLSRADKRALRAAGITVVEHDAPSELRLLRPSADIEGGALLACAMRALSEGDTAINQRALFTKLMAKALQEGAK